MSKLKKLILTALLSIFLTSSLLSLGAQSAKAQETWYDQGFSTWYRRVYDRNNPDEVFGERYTAANVQWIMYGLFSNILNFFIPSELSPCFFAAGPGTANSTLPELKDCADNLATSTGATSYETRPKESKPLFSPNFSAHKTHSRVKQIKNQNPQTTTLAEQPPTTTS